MVGSRWVRVLAALGALASACGGSVPDDFLPPADSADSNTAEAPFRAVEPRVDHEDDTVGVAPPPAEQPTTDDFGIAVWPKRTAPGEPVRLVWGAPPAADCTILEGFGPVAVSGSVMLHPLRSMTYHLWCWHEGERLEASATIEVDGAPPEGPCGMAEGHLFGVLTEGTTDGGRAVLWQGGAWLCDFRCDPSVSVRTPAGASVSLPRWVKTGDRFLLEGDASGDGCRFESSGGDGETKL